MSIIQDDIECSECCIFMEKFNNDEVTFKIYKVSNLDVIVIIKGDVSNNECVPLRIHSGCITGDIFGSKMCDCGKQLEYIYSVINNSSNGLLIYIPEHEGRGIGLMNKIKAYKLIKEKHIDTFNANTEIGFDEDLRNFSFVNTILKDLNVKSVDLYTNNPDKFKACYEYICNIVNIPNFINPHNFNYLQTKQDKKNHSLKLENYENIQKNNVVINTKNSKIGIIYTKWNERYVNLLKNGAYNKLLSLNFQKQNIDFIQVAGSYDLLSGIDGLINQGKNKYDAFLIIGILLKGETSHYDFLMNCLSNGIYSYQLKYNIPIVNGILTCENDEQIKNRTINNNHGVFWGDAILNSITSNYVTNFYVKLWNKFNNLYIFQINNDDDNSLKNINIQEGKYNSLITINNNIIETICTIKNNLLFVDLTSNNFDKNSILLANVELIEFIFD